MTTPRLHMIGNAHLDPVWLWRWPEGCAEAIGTCWTAAELLDEYPGFIFTRGEAVVYRWIEELEPELFTRIQRLVSQGRWTIVNGWWLQPDCNIPDGESFIRQALYGKRYFQERFGIDVSVGYNVDSFGHAGTLPMLLRHTGYDAYVFMRPMAHEKTLPASLFDWTAPDGSAVSAFRIPLGYGTWKRQMSVEEKIVSQREASVAAQTPLMCFYGVGNHGGGPTRRELEAIAGAGEDVIFSDPARYFAATAALPRPTVQDELQHHAIGCYAAISSLKSLNRHAESALAQAEAAAAMALVSAGTPYPHAEFRGLWETLLFNQFHDILCGTSLQSATRDAEHALGGVIHGAESLMNAALRRVARTVRQAPVPTESAFLVFNPTGSAQQVPLEYEPWIGWDQLPDQLYDGDGSTVPVQLLHQEAFASPQPRLLFAPTIPAYGYQLFRAARRGPDSTPAPAAASSLVVAPQSLESAAWLLEIDPQSGGIARLFDKRAGREVFSAAAHTWTVVDDPTDTWSHGLDAFGFAGEAAVCDGIEVLEQGPLRAALKVRVRCAHSTIASTYLLYDDPALPLEIRVGIDWHEQRKLLRLRYPAALPDPQFRYEVPYGSMRRADDGQEWPGQRWALVSGSDGYAFALANDAKYSYAALDGALYITALRSPVFAHHEPYILDPAREYPCTDQGAQSFTLRLMAGTAVDAPLAHRLAEGLIRPLIALPHVSRTGSAPYCGALPTIEARTSVVTWLKVAEDSGDLLLRVLEVSGNGDLVQLPDGTAAPLRPYGVATFRRGSDGSWREANGLETVASTEG